MSNDALISRIRILDVVGIRTVDYPDYLNMWIVEVDGRLFARSWTKSRSSWFWAFVDKGECLMMVDGVDYQMAVSKLEGDESLHIMINEAYENRYGKGSAASIAKAMQDSSRWPMTVEFRLKP
ncbi:DUF2255 family protein [Photobacterium sp. BZF1]|uniref:DUF2255 family protein n=1 Tax=Photobacterium sp. BZF1 TaxID=1904457 RepID=UPI00165395D3|nr:DUF2255 family protein [Photobacterium sp. BZF1]MBC7006576.1 DUF2255 family protein [Photobacterium sp. BZF1]